MTGTPALEFNPFLPEVHVDPYPLYQRLRAEDPVHRNGPGFWLLTRYADVVAVLRHPRMSRDPRRSAQYQRIREANGGQDPWADAAPSMLFVDPPDHTRLRTLVNKAFTPPAIARLRARVEELVDELLDRTAGAGEMDLVDDLAYPLPVTVICELFGVPPADRGRFRDWSGALVHLLDPLVAEDMMERALGARAALRAYLGELVAERRARPQRDLLTALVAGHETTVNLIANGTLALLGHPAERARLAADPALAASAVEELLRFDSPVQLTSRHATDDLEVGGQLVREGETVIAALGAANRDPAQFPDPDRLDLARAPNRHVAFGGGIHFCLGAPLARMEAQIALTALLRRHPDLTPGEAPPTWRDTVTLRGLATFPVRF